MYNFQRRGKNEVCPSKKAGPPGGREIYLKALESQALIHLSPSGQGPRFLEIIPLPSLCAEKMHVPLSKKT